MADLASGVSSEGTPKTGGAADEGAGIEGSKEEAGGGHDGLRTFTARGGEPAVMLELWRAFSEDGEAGHVCDALMTARTNRKPKSGLLFHSDRTEADKAEGRQTKKEERVAVCEYREPYYNKRRRHSAHGYATPIALTHYGAAYPTVRHIGGSPP